MSKRLIRILPLIIFILLAFFLYKGLYLHPRLIPSQLINQQAPSLLLPTLDYEKVLFDKKTLLGRVWLLNVFATWCMACQDEHPYLLSIAHNGIPIVGLDYKDNIAEAKKWLQDYGSPYQAVLNDKEGKIAIEWGVYGAPETFIIDKTGRVRYKHLGVVNQKVWQDTLLPIIQKLKT